ncbi:MAG: putative quinol monooxygenase [Devosia sp.]
MAKVRLEGYLEVPADSLDQVKATLPLHIALTRAEPGCLSFAVTQRLDLPERFAVAEVFADQHAFDQQQARAKASVWAAVTAGMDRHYTITTAGVHDAEPALSATRPSTGSSHG